MKLSYKYHTFNVSLCTLRCLKRHMRYVRAAGGIIHDDEGNMLLILRNNRWDLPKGKVEAGETLLQGALREVEEETGIRAGIENVNNPNPKSLRSRCPLKTYHIFNLYGGWHLKQTSWFDMHAEGVKPMGKPQQEEGITDIVWVTPEEWQHRLATSYGTLRTLAKEYKQKQSIIS